MNIPAAPASLPVPAAHAASDPQGWGGSPAGDLPGWDPAWSRHVTAATLDGEHTFHVLDTAAVLEAAGITPTGTILAVHGNPTWSYLWRSLAQATVDQATAGGTAWRVVAPDQLDMGFSERIAHPSLPQPAPAARSGEPTTDSDYRTLTGRVTDLDAIVRALGLDEDARNGHRLVTLGHDWGGVISLGWAGRNLDLVSAITTLNTAVHHRPEDPIPAPLQAALAGPLLAGSTVVTDAFLKVTTALGHPALTDEVKSAFHAPYGSADRRGGIGSFVADIPVGPEHGSHPELQKISTDLTRAQDAGVPALILWGPKDPVFLERYLADLLERLPHADLHRFETAGHLLPEDADITAPLMMWLDQNVTAAPAEARTKSATPAPAAAGWSQDRRPLWNFLDQWRESDDVAMVDLAGKHPGQVTWERLSAVVDTLAVGLTELGVRPGDRISLMVPPGRDLTAILYAALRIGAVGVVADAGLGIAGMTRAVRAARPRWIIGETPGLSVARLQNWPGRRISVATMSRPAAAALGVEDSINALIARYDGQRYSGPEPTPESDAAILYTSGSTGPAKGVLYTHGRLSALAGLLREVFNVQPGSSLLAGFAPFALLGPAIGATSATPNMSVTRPASLTAKALAEAAQTAGATIVFASPAALRNVVATADQLDDDQRAALARVDLVLSAGAPVHPDLMAQVAMLVPNAQIHSPYGMTESLLLTDIDHQGVVSAAEDSDGGSQIGVCVGTPVGPVRVAIAALQEDGSSSDTLLEGAAAAGTLGEVVVSAPHMKARYDRLWYTDAQSKRDRHEGREWHRTQDVGHLDESGRLWIEGRLQHVVTTPQGPLAPGGPEAQIDTLSEISRSAIVGVGPAGTQAVVAVVELADDVRGIKPGLAPTDLAQRVRAAAAPVPIAAVLVTDKVPVDIRHQSKINRSRLADWADGVLAGGPVGTP